MREMVGGGLWRMKEIRQTPITFHLIVYVVRVGCGECLRLVGPIVHTHAHTHTHRESGLLEDHARTVPSRLWWTGLGATGLSIDCSHVQYVRDFLLCCTRFQARPQKSARG